MKNLIFIFVVACQSGNNFLYFVPQGKITADLMTEITKDVNDNLGCRALSMTNDHVSVGDNNTIERRLVTVKREKQENLGKDWGFFDIINNEISYSDVMDYETYMQGIKHVLLHELGHAMGLEHTDNTIMHPYLLSNEEGKTVSHFMPYKEGVQSLIELLNKHNKNQCDMVKE